MLKIKIRKGRKTRNLKEYNENLVTSIPAALATCDKKLKINTANKLFLRFFNLKLAEIKNKTLYDFFGSRLINQFELDEKIQKVFSNEHVIQEIEISGNLPSIGNKILEIKIYSTVLMPSIWSAISEPDFVKVNSFNLPCFSKLTRPDFSICWSILTT